MKFLKEWYDGNLDSEEEILCIMAKYIIGLSSFPEEKDILERNTGALTFTVIYSISQKGHISFDDLLIHIDCFSQILNHEGLDYNKIRQMYIPITKALVSNFKDMIIDSTTGYNFTDTPKYLEFKSLTSVIH